MSPLVSKRAILDDGLTPDQMQDILATIERLGRATMSVSSHGYIEGRGENVRAAAERSAKDYVGRSRSSAAIALMDVILAAHRNYNKQVVKHINNLHLSRAGLTFHQLNTLVQQTTKASEFQTVWGHNAPNKFRILQKILEVIVPRLEGHDTVENDYRTMAEWAAQANLTLWMGDAIGRIDGVGIATFQHLRMTFGVDTVKPDQRVKEVLGREFGVKASDIETIRLVEKMAALAGIKPLLIDQIFVKYGSGHYTSQATEVRVAVEKIVRKLKLLGVSPRHLADATGWSDTEIAQL